MSLFLDTLERRILFFDGAMGTMTHALDLDLERDYLGKENCTEVLLLTRPDAIQGIHEAYLEAGADGVETNTFGAMPHVLAEFDLQDRAREINRKGVEVARAACDKFSTPDRPRFVVGSIGPGTKLMSLGNIDWDTMFASYREQAMGLLEGGEGVRADVLLLETQQDLLAVKCIVQAIQSAMAELGIEPAVRASPASRAVPGPGPGSATRDADWARGRAGSLGEGASGSGRAGSPNGTVPIMVQVTIEQTGTMLTGSEIAAAAVALQELPIMSLGLNCATGPTDMAEHVGYLAKHWPRHISVLPNAGLPTLVEGRTEYPLGPKPFAQAMLRFVDEMGVSIIGGCCGTGPEHIRALTEAVGQRPRARVEKQPTQPSCSSLYSPTPYRQDTTILNVGERCNSSGSRAFKRLLEAEDWDEMVSLAREQMREGSHVLDVNVDYAGRDNAADMAAIVSRFVRQVDAPLMLDSTQIATIQAGLKHAGGKCIINSANLEDGEEKFAAVCKLALRYNAGLVLGTIDEDPEEAMARTADRKIEIARRMHDLATTKYGLRSADLFFDPLVLPISTGMEKDRRSALETIEGTRRIAAEFPNTQITCGLSNVSFGLKPAARMVLNSAFLHDLIEAGMTSAIVHVSKILPRNRIPDEQWDAALDLIYNRWPAEGQEVTLQDGTPTRDPLQIFVDLFPDGEGAVVAKQDLSELPLEERLQKHIIDGEKKNLDKTLEEAMTKYSPLDIINDHLLAGMKVVGELFGSGQMQLPFVLQSAEVMKTAVAQLEPHMERVEGQTKGTIVLATVKGDVHDIGKNLVDIILSNNGYTVHNLGIKQPISAILDKWKETNSDAIGMSGLLVKSVNVMEENLREMATRGVKVPVLLGGAALSRHYCDSHLRNVYAAGNEGGGEGGSTYHGKDAFEGLRIMDHLREGKLAELDEEIVVRLEKRADSEAKVAAMQAKKKDSGGGAAVEVPVPPFWGDRVVESVPLEQVYPFINRIALFRGQWQFKKGRKSDAEYQAQIKDEIEPLFEKLKAQMKEENVLQPRVAYGYFPCNRDAENTNDLILYDPKDPGRELERFSFPRQPNRKRLCITDFFKPSDSGTRDVIGLTCVTVGDEATRRAKVLFESNRYAEYLYLHGLGVETAEALAELWHKRMRQELGIAGDDASNVRDLFTQTYRGSRYSFGYPACPEMSDQDKLFRLLKPERIGCTLTENWQIDPEQSTSAIIVHHPEAKYFSV